MGSNELTQPEASRLEALEATIRENRDAFLAVGNALAEIKQRGLWRDKYQSFSHYLRDRWNWSVSYGFIVAARAVVQKNLEAEEAIPEGQTIPQAHAVRLAPLLPAAQVKVYREACERAEGDKPSAKLLGEVIEESRTREPPPIPESNRSASSRVIANKKKAAFKLIRELSNLTHELKVFDAARPHLNAIKAAVKSVEE